MSEPDLAEDLELAHAQMVAMRGLPQSERIKMLTRLMANILNKHGKLPDHLKRLADN